MADRFPIGAWVKDTAQATLTGGIVKDHLGRVQFLPYRGQVVRWVNCGRAAGYLIQFGHSRNVIAAKSASCDSCGTTDNADHHSACYETRRKISGNHRNHDR